MLKRIQEKRAMNEGGFTLIELLIVIVILGVLAAVVIFSVGGITNNSAAAACKADASTINSAAEASYAQTGVAAAGLNDLVTKSLLKPDPGITGTDPTSVKAGKGYSLAWIVGSAGGVEGQAGGVNPSIAAPNGCTNL